MLLFHATDKTLQSAENGLELCIQVREKVMKSQTKCLMATLVQD